MNVAAALAATAPTTFELSLVPSLVAPVAHPVPADTFVTKLVAALDAHFKLDASELELAELVLYGRSVGAIARTLQLSTRAAQTRLAALFAATHTDGRQQLVELAARLNTMRELAAYLMYSPRGR